MKVTPSGQNQTVANSRLKFVSQFSYARIVEQIFVAGVRSRHNVRDPIRNRGFRYRQRKFYIVRTVIYSWQDMTVHIDHSVRKLPSATKQRRPATLPTQTSGLQRPAACASAGAVWPTSHPERLRQKHP